MQIGNARRRAVTVDPFRLRAVPGRRSAVLPLTGVRRQALQDLISLHVVPPRFRLHQERKGFQAAGVDFGPIDFAGIAPGLGCHGVRTLTWREFDEAVTAALTWDRPTVIEVPVDPADYDRML